MEYYDYEDKDLVCLARSGDSRAVTFLLEKYRPLVRKNANALFLIGGDSDDLNQEGMIGLYQAVRDYDPQKGAAFSTFADLCIRRQMYHAIEADGRARNLPLNAAVPLDELEPSIPGGEEPEKQYLEKESRSRIEDAYGGILSPYEKKVLHYYLDGCRCSEIARILEKTPKSVDNAVQRIRRKMMEA